MSDLEGQQDPTSGTVGLDSTGRSPGLLGRLFRRRRFVVNPRYQFRVGLIAVMVVFALLLLLNLSLYFFSNQGSEAFLEVAPELEAYVRAQERVQLNLVLLGSIVFLGGTFAIALFETHRTAGAAYNIAEKMRDIAEGRYRARVNLRKGDNLRELESVFNQMAGSLRDRTLQDIDEIRTLAGRAEGLTDAEGRALATELLALADRKRKLVE